MHWANNYGGLLQCYALSTYLKDEGYNCEVVNYWPFYALRKRARIFGRQNVIAEFGDAAAKACPTERKKHVATRMKTKSVHIDAFRKNAINLGKVITDERQLKQQLLDYDSLISGSDQIWNPKITGGRFDDAYFLNFEISSRKIAYAASTGIPIPENLRVRFLELTSRFDAVSARESSLSSYLRKNGQNAPCVLDPVFLLPKEKWELIIPNEKTEKKYILVYTLERNSELIKTANSISSEMQLPLIVIGRHDLYQNVLRYAADESVEQFLSLILHAQFVVTNSFHGTAFSILFKKEFLTFPHSSKPTRMIDLLKRVGLENRLVSHHSQIEASSFCLWTDYNQGIDDKLNGLICFSKNFLLEALDKPKLERKHVTGKLCSGCSLCVHLCPVSAISMQTDDGYYHVCVDDDRCINCGRCIKSCPMIELHPSNRTAKLYAFKHRDDSVRKQSSSGGFFSVLAEHTIKYGGMVYGVRFDEQSRTAVYDRSETLEGVCHFRKSKYVQANVGTCFKNVEKDLSSGRKVLFTGSPCHVQALYTYLFNRKIDVKNLTTADMICHGTPSPAVLKGFLNYLGKIHGKPVSEFVFRDKETGWRGHGYRTVFEDGTSVLNDYYSMAWTKLFTLSINDVCFQCPFSSPSRIADFTMGDFWGIEKSECSDMEDELGVSLVLCNTQEADQLLQNMCDQCHYKVASIEACKKNNPLFRPTPKPSGYDAFQSATLSCDFQSVVKKYGYYTGFRKIREIVKWFIVYKTGMKDHLLKLMKM